MSHPTIMDQSFVCPACHAVHSEPAGAAFVLAVLCLDCELAERYHAELSEIAIVVAVAA